MKQEDKPIFAERVRQTVEEVGPLMGEWPQPSTTEPITTHGRYGVRWTQKAGTMEVVCQVFVYCGKVIVSVKDRSGNYDCYRRMNAGNLVENANIAVMQAFCFVGGIGNATQNVERWQKGELEKGGQP